ncbi:MAG: ABC transporter ATP-binding protein [Acidimicrobiales bacterium]|jgi:ABC-2 type transport system ATP-binding protein
MPNVIEVNGLTKRFGSLTAVNDVSFHVEQGEIFGLLGKNGAGKTTTVEILEGYQSPDEGRVQVLGVDPKKGGGAWKDRIGLVLQDSDFDPSHTVTETVKLFAGFFSHPRSVAETLELVGLTDKANTRIGRLSGGQRRRVDVALGIVGSPELLFLDEPTTGFDPSARREFWTMLEGLRSSGTSILLTTHYMEEAQHLCDRIAILAAGRIVAEGTSTSLIALAGATTLRFEAVAGLDVAALSRGTGIEFRLDGDVVSATLEHAQSALLRLLQHLESAGLEVGGLEVVRPTLDDVFLDVTGERS